MVDYIAWLSSGTTDGHAKIIAKNISKDRSIRHNPNVYYVVPMRIEQDHILKDVSSVSFKDILSKHAAEIANSEFFSAQKEAGDSIPIFKADANIDKAKISEMFPEAEFSDVQLKKGQPCILFRTNVSGFSDVMNLLSREACFEFVWAWVDDTLLPPSLIKEIF